MIILKNNRGKKVTFISNVAAIRGEETTLKIRKIFSVHFFYMTKPQKNFKLSKLRNGEKGLRDGCGLASEKLFSHTFN